jgi:hypothetical protein
MISSMENVVTTAAWGRRIFAVTSATRYFGEDF